jgi:D-tyrosyl-tRNA(Tyr) deacylase
MTAVVQRVLNAEVRIGGEVVGKCDGGLMILLGVAAGDAEEDAIVLAEKLLKFRIFSDENGKMNLSVKDVAGSILVVSNSTLAASYRKGNRPDFIATAASPALARSLYHCFCDRMAQEIHTETGEFGADMQISLCNDGPVTFVLDSRVLLKK